MKPICVKCQRFYRPKCNGIAFVENMPMGRAEPYKLWVGDLWECLGCGHELISGVGSQPVSEHYKADFKETVTSYKPEITINDC
jgi:hypothetical protein